MKPLNNIWIERYYSFASCNYGYEPKNKWVGAWYLMRDFQNTSVVIKEE